MTDTRKPAGFRLAPATIERLDALALEHSTPQRRLSRTDVLKAHLAVAQRHEDELIRTLKRLGEI